LNPCSQNTYNRKRPMSQTAISFDNVSKKFKRGEMYDSLRDFIPALVKQAFKKSESDLLTSSEFWALRNISFSVAQGESVGIIGHNGAGKSTMLKHLNGIMKPTGGTITVNGKLSALIEIGAGFHPDLSGRENIFLNGTILGMSRAEIRRKFDEIVDFSGLEEFIDTPVKRYSSGMHARLGFSVAVHLEPDILVVDEVLSVGDYVFQKKGLDKMHSILKGGATVLFVSHNLRAVSDLCDRSLLLDHGRVLLDGPTHEVIDCYYQSDPYKKSGEDDKDVILKDILTYGANGEQNQFYEKEKLRLEVCVKGIKKVDKLSVCIYVQDDNNYSIFDTSTERLTKNSFSIDENEIKKHIFELELNLGPGTYHIGALIYRYDIQKTYDFLFPAKTIFVKSDRDARGAANLYPVLIEVP